MGRKSPRDVNFGNRIAVERANFELPNYRIWCPPQNTPPPGGVGGPLIIRQIGPDDPLGQGGFRLELPDFGKIGFSPPPPPGGISRIPRFSTIPKIPILDIPNSRICEIEISISKLSCIKLFFPRPRKNFPNKFCCHAFI